MVGDVPSIEYLGGWPSWGLEVVHAVVCSENTGGRSFVFRHDSLRSKTLGGWRYEHVRYLRGNGVGGSQ